MKRIFITALIIIVVLYLGIMTVGMFAGSFSQNKEKIYEMRELKKENRELKAENYRIKIILGKYADSLSDKMLLDLYPKQTDADTLRTGLKDDYINYLSTKPDSLDN